MLLPALSRAKAKTKTKAIKCVGNLKLISLSNYMYISDTGKPVHYESWPYLWISQLQVKYAAIKDFRAPLSNPYFADSVWVDAWPVETDRPA